MQERFAFKYLPLVLLASLLFITGCGDRTPIDPTLLELDAAWSPDGSTIAYHYCHPRDPDSSGIWLIDSNGTNPRLFAEGCIQADWSPDGKRLAIATAGWNIFLVGKDSANFEWLIRDGESNSPAWSPDGKWIAFVRPFNGGAYLIDLETHEQTAIPGGDDWSPDSKELVFPYMPTDTIFLKVTTLSNMEVRIIFQKDKDKYGTISPPPRWSPDGEKILFQIDLDIWVIDTTGNNLKRLARDAIDANWSHDGEHIVYTPFEDSARLWIMNANGWNKHPLREK